VQLLNSDPISIEANMEHILNKLRKYLESKHDKNSMKSGSQLRHVGDNSSHLSNAKQHGDFLMHDHREIMLNPPKSSVKQTLDATYKVNIVKEKSTPTSSVTSKKRLK
jgi:hypothetical protein